MYFYVFSNIITDYISLVITDYSNDFAMLHVTRCSPTLIRKTFV